MKIKHGEYLKDKDWITVIKLEGDCEHTVTF